MECRRPTLMAPVRNSSWELPLGSFSVDIWSEKRDRRMMTPWTALPYSLRPFQGNCAFSARRRFVFDEYPDLIGRDFKCCISL